MIKERIEVLNQIEKLSNDMSKIDFILDENYKFLVIEINPDLKETILITAGCHGNEPAPVYAIKKFLEENNFSKNKRIILIPCVNPTGFVLNSEDTKDGININRNFKENSESKEANFLKKIVERYNPEFVVNLHEDPDETGFYIWVEESSKKPKANELIKKLNVSYFKDKDINGHKVKEGIILNSKNINSFEDYLIEKNIPSFCTETPGAWSIEKRIKTNLNILNLIINDNLLF